MSVLRDHRESVMAVLEAFVYDPLINWRLLRPARESMHETPQVLSIPSHPTLSLRAPPPPPFATPPSPPPLQEGEGGAEGRGKELGGADEEGTIPQRCARNKPHATTMGHGASEDLLAGEDGGEEGGEMASEVLNSKALAVIERVQDKLTGRDFDTPTALDVQTQVRAGGG